MNQPGWKRWLSHLFELHIESAPSEHNPHLYVCLAKGRYQLATKSAIYSFSDLYDNYRITFEHLNWSRLPKRCNVLLLGLGLGSVPDMLERKFFKDCSYTGVEIDENVLYLANKYVLHELKSPMSIHCADAYDFVQQNTRRFDIICMDVFIDDQIPQRMMTAKYLKALKSALTSKGVLMYNCLAQSDADIVHTRTFLHEIFLSIFPEGGYLDVRGNWMLVSDKEILV